MSLRELQGVIGAHEWRKNGIKIPALDGRIHPWYGVFPPIRSEYIDLVARAPSERKDIAFDIGYRHRSACSRSGSPRCT